MKEQANQSTPGPAITTKKQAQQDAPPANTFKWDQEDSPRIFPIDYSVREFSRLIDENPNSILRNAIKHPLLKDILYSFVSTNPDAAVRSDSGKYPVPLEAGHFLEAFYKLVVSSKYHQSFCCGDRHPSDMKDEFTADLLEQLRLLMISSRPDEDNPHPDYCAFERHILFKDPCFLKALLDDLWNTQLQLRIEYLKQMPLYTQVGVLSQVIMSMDKALVLSEMSGPLPEKPVEAGYKPIQHLLSSLLSARKKVKGTGEGPYRMTSYYVKNSDVKHDKVPNMHDAFHTLNNYRKPNPELMRSARQSYLTHLVDPASPSDIEERYFAIIQYLSFDPLHRSDEKWEIDIRNMLVEICSPVIDYMLNSETTSAALSNFLHFDLLFHEMAKHGIEGAMAYFCDCIDLTCHLHLISMELCRLESEWADITNLPEVNILRKNTESVIVLEILQSFSQFFLQAWGFLYGGNPSSEGLSTDIKNTSQRFHGDSLSSAQLFHRPDTFNYTAARVEEMFSKYFEMLDHPNDEYIIDDFLFFAAPMLTGVMLQVLERIIKDHLPALVKATKTFSTRMQQKHSELARTDFDLRDCYRNSVFP